jgi:ATP-binding cassette subfamily A (ABC1) protein 3
MTVREHLEFYAAIKGVVYSRREEQVKTWLKEMDLLEYENIRMDKLSGGNKRKTSVAMAMIGNPPIIFLDEPSTGVDPKARRFMWGIVSKISTLRKKSSVIITTHSMEEAEALCTKMGIMVKGRFKCFGSTSHIKTKYGTGYEIEIKTVINEDEQHKVECRQLCSKSSGKDKVIEGEAPEIIKKLL